MIILPVRPEIGGLDMLFWVPAYPCDGFLRLLSFGRMWYHSSLVELFNRFISCSLTSVSFLRSVPLAVSPLGFWARGFQ